MPKACSTGLWHLSLSLSLSRCLSFCPPLSRTETIARFLACTRDDFKPDLATIPHEVDGVERA